MSIDATSSRLADSEVTLSKRGPCRRVSVHVQLLWTTLSLVVTAGCSFSFVQPHWFVQRQTRDSLGLYNYCVRDNRGGSITGGGSLAGSRLIGGGRGDGGGQVGALTARHQLCGVYGGQFNLSNLPSNAWQIACVLYGGGCVLLGCGSLAAVLTLCLPRVWSHRLSCYTGYIQTMAGNAIL